MFTCSLCERDVGTWRFNRLDGSFVNDNAEREGEDGPPTKRILLSPEEEDEKQEESGDSVVAEEVQRNIAADQTTTKSVELDSISAKTEANIQAQHILEGSECVKDYQSTISHQNTDDLEVKTSSKQNTEQTSDAVKETQDEAADVTGAGEQLEAGCLGMDDGTGEDGDVSIEQVRAADFVRSDDESSENILDYVSDAVEDLAPSSDSDNSNNNNSLHALDSSEDEADDDVIEAAAVGSVDLTAASDDEADAEDDDLSVTLGDEDSENDDYDVDVAEVDTQEAHDAESDDASVTLDDESDAEVDTVEEDGESEGDDEEAAEDEDTLQEGEEESLVETVEVEEEDEGEDGLPEDDVESNDVIELVDLDPVHNQENAFPAENAFDIDDDVSAVVEISNEPEVDDEEACGDANGNDEEAEVSDVIVEGEVAGNVEDFGASVASNDVEDDVVLILSDSDESGADEEEDDENDEEVEEEEEMLDYDMYNFGSDSYEDSSEGGRDTSPHIVRDVSLLDYPKHM